MFGLCNPCNSDDACSFKADFLKLKNGALSGSLATVTGKLLCEALTSNNELTSEVSTTVTDEDEILSASPTVEGLLKTDFWINNVYRRNTF